MALLDQVLGPLEIALNRTLAASPTAMAELAEDREPMALYFRDLGWGFRMIPAAHGLQLMPGVEDSRAAVSTSLVGLARLLSGEDPREMGQALLLEGDAEYADRLMHVFRSARLDLETELRSLMGPLLGARLGQGLKGVMEFGREGFRNFLMGGAGGAADAKLADAGEVRDWMDSVDDLATDLDRIEARIARLEQRREDV